MAAISWQLTMASVLASKSITASVIVAFVTSCPMICMRNSAAGHTDGSAGIKLTSGADVTHQRPKWICDSARVRAGHVIFHEPGAPFGGLVLPTSSMSGCAQQFGPEMVSGWGLM